MKNFLNASVSLAACALVCFSAVGCRSYNDSAWKTVDFVSVPEHATLFINGKNCGQTPRTERLSRDGSYDVRFSKPGYFDEDCLMESTVGEDGLPDILDRLEVELVKITPETLAAREREAKGAGTDGKADAASSAGTPPPQTAGGMSAAAVEFSKREKPTNFTDFRLQEKALRRLLLRGEITEEEYRAIHENLYDSYNENRLLKAPRLGTYEKTR